MTGWASCLSTYSPTVPAYLLHMTTTRSRHSAKVRELVDKHYRQPCLSSPFITTTFPCFLICRGRHEVFGYDSNALSSWLSLTDWCSCSGQAVCVPVYWRRGFGKGGVVFFFGFFSGLDTFKLLLGFSKMT